MGLTFVEQAVIIIIAITAIEAQQSLIRKIHIFSELPR